MSTSKVFTDYQEFESKSPRNSYDLSKRVYGTYQYGALYPIATYEINYGESIELDIESLLNFFPMTWPVQTPSRVHYYVFYDRWRNCMKSWKDFRFNNKKVVHPFILQPASNTNFWKTGSLVDHLGIPTTLTTQDFSTDLSLKNTISIDLPTYHISNVTFFALDGDALQYDDFNIRIFNSSTSIESISSFHGVVYQPSAASFLIFNKVFDFSSIRYLSSIRVDPSFENFSGRFLMFGVRRDGSSQCVAYRLLSGLSGSSIDVGSVSDWYLRYSNGTSGSNSSFLSVLGYINQYYDFESFRFSLMSTVQRFENLGFKVGQIYNPLTFSLVYSVQGSIKDFSDASVVNPFAGTYDNPPQVPLNALPFRTYERVYNCYFRDEKVDPFVKDGEVQYNEFQTTNADGADTTDYHLFFRNWQKDFLTSATPTPQQGVAPLVGINYRGDMEFMNEDGTIAKIRPTLAADGTTVTGISGTIENGTPEALRSAMDLVSMGISIQDFRNVNALQRWLENNIRRGLRYRDQVLANTGIPIKFDELDLPEFIGGFSRPVQVSQVTQMTPSTGETNALGSRAGQASAFGGSKHKIRHYCDEAGCVMVIMCVTPDPVYTQLLPKIFLKSDPLSYYNEQFGHIGPQPISYREVAPVQCANFDFDLNKTFGYQRAWYDLISSTDDAHGQFRLPAMRDMLMQRTFSGVPVLGRDFVTIDPAQINDVFAYRNPDPDAQEDVIAGQTYIQCYIKRPIPRFGQPRLEA